MTDKEKRELKDSIINIFKRFNILGNTASIGELRNNILRCVDSMQEDPVSEDLERASEDYCKSTLVGSPYIKKNAFKAGANWQKTKEDPVSEDLEEAADDALNSVLNTHEIVNIRSCLEMFRLGAKWQKQQDQSTIELAEDHAMLAGMEKMKEQMMAKAIDGIARPYDNEIWCTLDSFNLEDDDKVKVIVIKED